MGLSTENRASIKEDALHPMVDLLKTEEEAQVCIFVYCHGKAGRIASLLEDICPQSFLHAGVFTINGDMDKHQKIAFVWLFTSVYQIDGSSFCVLVATAATNTGTSQPLCVRVICLGLPRYPTMLLQERGCLARKTEYTVISLCWSVF